MDCGDFHRGVRIGFAVEWRVYYIRWRLGVTLLGRSADAGLCVELIVCFGERGASPAAKCTMCAAPARYTYDLHYAPARDMLNRRDSAEAGMFDYGGVPMISFRLVAVVAIVTAALVTSAAADPPDFLRNYRFVTSHSTVHVSGG